MKKRVLPALTALLLPLVSAAGFDPIDFLENEWFKFGVIFILLFLAIYSFFYRKMNNPAVSTITALGLSALISIPIMKRGLIEPFLEPEVVDWIGVFALVILVIFLFYKFGLKTNDYGRKVWKLWRALVFLAGLLILIWYIQDVLPDSIKYSPVGDAINAVENLGWWAVFIFIAGWAIVKFVNYKRRGLDYRQRGREEEIGKKSI